MDLLEAIYSRRSVRDFSDAPIDEGLVRHVIDAAIQAPSALNTQPWHFSVVRDRAKLAAISREAKAHLLRSAMAGSLPQPLLQALDNPDFDIFYNAPVLVVISTSGAGAFGVIDAALAAQNLMLAARASDLGTCWIGLAQAWLGTDEGKAGIALPADHVPVAPLIMGHPRGSPPAVPRNAPRIDWVDG